MTTTKEGIMIRYIYDHNTETDTKPDEPQPDEPQPEPDDDSA
jgi:hypothetical protein